MSGQDTTAPHPEHANVLQTAEHLIYGPRADEYGDAFVSFGNIAKGWSVILGVEVPPEAVALCMDWLKTCRLLNTPAHRDSIVDKAGYAGCYEKIIMGRAKHDAEVAALMVATPFPIGLDGNF